MDPIDLILDEMMGKEFHTRKGAALAKVAASLKATERNQVQYAKEDPPP